MSATLYHKIPGSPQVYKEIEINCKNSLIQPILNNIKFNTKAIRHNSKTRLRYDLARVLYRVNPSGKPFLIVNSEIQSEFTHIQNIISLIYKFNKYVANSFFLPSSQLRCAIEICYQNSEKYQTIIHKEGNNNFRYFSIKKEYFCPFMEMVINEQQINQHLMQNEPKIRFAYCYKKKLIIIIENAIGYIIPKLLPFLKEMKLDILCERFGMNKFYNINNIKDSSHHDFSLFTFPNEIVDFSLYQNPTGLQSPFCPRPLFGTPPGIFPLDSTRTFVV